MTNTKQSNTVVLFGNKYVNKISGVLHDDKSYSPPTKLRYTLVLTLLADDGYLYRTTSQINSEFFMEMETIIPLRYLQNMVIGCQCLSELFKELMLAAIWVIFCRPYKILRIP